MEVNISPSERRQTATEIEEGLKKLREQCKSNWAAWVKSLFEGGAMDETRAKHHIGNLKDIAWFIKGLLNQKGIDREEDFTVDHLHTIRQVIRVLEGKDECPIKLDDDGR